MGSRPVNISGTFSKNERPSNGLEELADELYAKQFDTHYVVGIVQYSGVTGNGPGEPLIPRVKFLGIEPLAGDAAEQAQQILDQARKSRGLGRMEDAIPAPDAALFEFDEDGHPTVPEVRDGRDVPPPSADELLAERAEAKAAERVETPEESAAIVDGNLRRKGSAGLKPKPTTEPFKAGDDA